MNFRSKHQPLLAQTKPPPANKTAYCGKCGKPGGLICTACHEAYKAWVEKNTQRDGRSD